MKIPKNLTVIFRDETPMLSIGEHCSYRRVTIELAPEQIEKLKPHYLGQDRGRECYEEINICFIEFEQ